MFSVLILTAWGFQRGLLFGSLNQQNAKRPPQSCNFLEVFNVRGLRTAAGKFLAGGEEVNIRCLKH